LKHLEDKSEQNLKAAENLKDSKFHASSVHCSYYSLVQRCSVIFCKENNKKPNQIIGICKKQKIGVHVFLMEEIMKLLQLKGKSEDEARAFQAKFEDLKKFRNKSDYKDEKIEIYHSSTVLLKSEALIDNLKSIFS
jgi:hypothetical protein